MKERTEYLDVLRAIAIVLVVVVHSLGGFSDTSFGSEVWWISNVVNTVTHCAVPLFVMLSGTLLLSGKYTDLSSFCKKRFSKVLIPFFTWSIIFFLANAFVLNKPLSADNLLFSFLSDIWTNNIVPVYWYIYMLIGLYTIIPIVHPWANKEGNESEVIVFIALWFLLLFGFSQEMIERYNLYWFTGYAGYLLLGFYMGRLNLELKRYKYMFLLLFIVSAGITIAGKYFFPGMITDGYLTPNIAILSLSAFGLIKAGFYPRNTTILYGVTFLSLNSYGIYLIHAVFISLMSKAGIDALFISPYLGMFIVAGVSILLSIILVVCIKRIAFVRNIAL